MPSRPGGAGWPLNFDKAAPISIGPCKELNDEYIRQQLTLRKPDEHSPQMVKEVIEEVKLARMVGPFAAPRKGS